MSSPSETASDEQFSTLNLTVLFLCFCAFFFVAFGKFHSYVVIESSKEVVVSYRRWSVSLLLTEPSNKTIEQPIFQFPDRYHCPTDVLLIVLLSLATDVLSLSYNIPKRPRVAPPLLRAPPLALNLLNLLLVILLVNVLAMHLHMDFLNWSPWLITTLIA